MESRQPENPFIHQPDEHVVAAELYCWMPSNQDRECGPDCVAYDPRHLEETRITSCSVLNIVKSIGISFSQVAAPLVQMNRRAESNARSEKVKEVTTDPPVVR